MGDDRNFNVFVSDVIAQASQQVDRRQVWPSEQLDEVRPVEHKRARDVSTPIVHARLALGLANANGPNFFTMSVTYSNTT